MAMDTDFDAAATTIMDHHRTFTDDTVEEFRKLASADVHWQDPLIEVKGIDKVVAYAHKLFDVMADINIEIKNYSRSRQILFLHMLMTFQIKKMPGKKQEIDYVQKVVFDDGGLIIDVKEYWDLTPALESAPVLGKVVTLTKKMMRKQFA